MKKLFASLLVMSLFFCYLLEAGTATAESETSPSTTFSDIKGHWAEAQIKSAVTKGYVNGYENGTFKPNAEVSKAEFTKMLTAALKLDVTEGGSPWYQAYVKAAKEAGIYADDFKSDSWNKSIPRKEMSLLGVRAGVTGYKKDFDINRNLYEAAKAGIIQGTAPGVVDPDGVTTRAAAVVVIERVLAVKGGKTLTSDKYATAASEVLWHKTNVQTMLPRYFSNPVYGDFKADKMVTKSPNGNVVCSVSQIVVIDLDDPKDPNRKLIDTYNLSWQDGSKYYRLSESGGYAVIALSNLEYKGTAPTEIYPCTVSIENDDLYVLKDGVTSPKNPNKIYGLLPWDSSFGQPKFRIKATDWENNKYTYANGTLFPKGSITSNKEFKLMFSEMGNWQGDVYSLITSIIK